MTWLKVLVLAIRVISYDDKEPSDRVVEAPSGEINTWGPKAVAARSEGTIPSIHWTSEMLRWQRWGRNHLQDGDLVHRLGDARLARGLYPFSRALAKVTESQYSHTAIVSMENGEPFIYDATKAGIRRQPFAIYMIDVIDNHWCVTRSSQLDAKKAIAYAKQHWQDQTPFDFDLSPDDSHFYCVELAVKSYRAGGVGLGLPRPILLIPGIRRWPVTLWGFSKMGLNLTMPVWYVGNKQHGILSSPLLSIIHENQSLTD